MSTSTLPELLTPADVADWLEMPRARVIGLALAGEIPCFEIVQGEPRFDAEQLCEWIKSRRQLPSGHQGEK